MPSEPPDPNPTPTPAAGATRVLPSRSGKRSRKNSIHHWVRFVHVYASMIAFLVILFFGVTGITLNHPTWTLGHKATTTTYTGNLPVGWNANPVDFLAVTEYVRKTYSVSAPISTYSDNPGSGSISFRNPGYAADLSFSTTDGKFTLTVVQQGFVGVLNDLHKGRDANSAWKWLIDVAALFLVAVALTGLGIQLFLKKRRTRALAIAGAGLVVTVLFMWFSV